jgi:phospholipid/cholesterol/gamma-HCH transport system substrate-binding protein
MEREARYAVVAGFVLLAVAAAFAFVWWYSGRGDRRSYDAYEIYFQGSVSGLSQGSPVRYLGVDVGRVRALSVSRDDPGRVKVVAEIDSETPVSGATRARLGLLGLTGLLYIDLQVDPEADAGQPLARGDEHPVILARKGDIEAFLERLPDLVARAGAVMGRVERLLGDDTLAAIEGALADVRKASATLPSLSRDAAQLLADLRVVARDTAALAQRMNGLATDSEPDLRAAIESGRVAAQKLAATAASLERIVAGNEAALAGAAGPGIVEVQQLVIDLRQATDEMRALAQELRERPSSLLVGTPEGGVEIKP